MASEREHFENARQWQEYFQREVGDEVGLQIPAPIMGQTSNDYQRETMRLLKRTFLPKNHPLYKMNMRALPADVLPGIRDNLINGRPATREDPGITSIKFEAENPINVPKGEIR